MKQEEIKEKMWATINRTLEVSSTLSQEMKDLSEEMTDTGEKGPVHRDARIRLFGSRVQDKNGTLRAATTLFVRN